MARQARPLGSAPRRMRRTLYCAPVSPAAFKSCSASWPRVSAVCKSDTKTHFSREKEELESLNRRLTPQHSRYNDECQEERIRLRQAGRATASAAAEGGTRSGNHTRLRG